MRFVDLECGIGGFSLGIIRSGHELLFATDHDDHFLDTFKKNFPYTKTPEATLVKTRDIPHSDVVCGCIRDILGMSNFLALVKPIMPRVIMLEIAKKIDVSRIWALGYRPYSERLNAIDFGLPQRRKMNFSVGFRKDIKPLFMSFPFPYGYKKPSLYDILETEPNPNLLATERILSKIKKGVSKPKVFSKHDVFVRLSPRYANDKTEFLVEGPHGPRRISVLEGKRIMGFPDHFILPENSNVAFRMLGSATCPPVAKVMVDEVADWVF